MERLTPKEIMDLAHKTYMTPEVTADAQLAKDKAYIASKVEEVKKILGQRFGEIATSKDGVWSGYQLTHKVIKDFAQQIIQLLKGEG